MNLPKPEDALHNAKIVSILTAVADDKLLRSQMFFKGGTCAAMLGYIDRFSVDIDFDIKKEANKTEIKKAFYKIFEERGFKLDDESRRYMQFVLKYDNPIHDARKTLKIDVNDDIPKNNKYDTCFIPEISRTLKCQTVETMFANKLIAFINRHEKKEKIAGRDVYDIHQLFIRGYKYDPKIIKERTKLEPVDYLKKLKQYIEKYITTAKLETDLNNLLEPGTFRKATKSLKAETLSILDNEIKRLERLKK